jgi:hypothetical protein
MAKPLQQDSEGNIINDVETVKNQKGYANYEAENARAQKALGYSDKDEPSMLSKAKKAVGDVVGDVAGGAYDQMVKSFGEKSALRQHTVKDMKNPPEGKAKGGMVKSSASKRADGCAIKGKTRA